MKDTRMERLVLLPFSVGCISQSSVAVGHEPQPRKSSKPSITDNAPNSAIKGAPEEDEDSLSSGESLKNTSRQPALQKPNISSGFHRLYKSLKSFSQSFIVDKEEMEELEMDIEIGFPTDVKHVTHIGWDGSATNNPIKGWDNLIPPELLSLPQLSLRQLDQFSMGLHAQQLEHQSLPTHRETSSDDQM